MRDFFKKLGQFMCKIGIHNLETYDTKEMSVIVPEEIVKQLICE